MKSTLYIMVVLFYTTMLSAQKSQQGNMKTMEVPEANLVFEVPAGWEFSGKTGKLEQGKVQYSYSHEHVEGKSRPVNPSIILTVDKGSWFPDEKTYPEKKTDFHKAMGDTVKKTHAPVDENNPLQIHAYYAEGVSTQEDHPYGQQYIWITFWTREAGVHMEIQTSEKDLKNNEDKYRSLISSVRKM